MGITKNNSSPDDLAKDRHRALLDCLLNKDMTYCPMHRPQQQQQHDPAP